MAFQLRFAIMALACLLWRAAPVYAADGLQQALDSAREACGSPAAVICHASLDGAVEIFAASGVKNLETGEAVQPGDLFAIGSLTKMFIAVVVLQLSAEGRLSLDDPLSAYLPDFPNAAAIPLRLLLQHRSGLGDPTQVFFNGAPQGEFKLGLASAALALALARQWTPEELTALIAATPPDFPPGTDCAYSNSNYLLLGRVIQAATGHSVAQELRARIFTPLGMDSTLLAGEEPLPATTMRCYALQRGQYVDCLELENAGFAWTAGAMASTAPDLLRFARALFRGELLPPEQLAQMLSFVPIRDMGYYGLGLTRHGRQQQAWGHTGRTVGFSTCLWYYPADGSIIIVLSNLQRCDLLPLRAVARNAAPE